LEQLYEMLGPIIEAINDVIETVTGTAMEVACCAVSPHEQALLQIVKSLIDYSTCFAAPFEGLLDTVLKVSHEPFFMRQYQHQYLTTFMMLLSFIPGAYTRHWF
jgi:hypothetical protein